jgi:hypothetical protein
VPDDMTTKDRAMKAEAVPQVAGMSSAVPEAPGPQIERIRRIGERLFGLQACVVVLEDAFQPQGRSNAGASSCGY